MSQERRHFSRVDFESSVSIQILNQNLQANLVDISLKGALVSLPAGPTMEKDQSCVFELHLDQDRASVRMNACVVYIKDDLLGLRFESPDLESITHLRRLLELNTGDSALVQNELFFLAGSNQEK